MKITWLEEKVKSHNIWYNSNGSESDSKKIIGGKVNF